MFAGAPIAKDFFIAPNDLNWIAQGFATLLPLILQIWNLFTTGVCLLLASVYNRHMFYSRRMFYSQRTFTTGVCYSRRIVIGGNFTPSECFIDKVCYIVDSLVMFQTPRG